MTTTDAVAGVDPDDDFYEDDEPVADVLAAWGAGAGAHLTAPPQEIPPRSSFLEGVMAEGRREADDVLRLEILSRLADAHHAGEVA